MADTATATPPAAAAPAGATAASSSSPSPPPEQQSTTPASTPPPPAAAAAAAAAPPAAAAGAFDPELLEVKDLVQKALERQGLLNHVRALLRAAVSVAIDNSTEDLALLHPNQRVREFAAAEEGQLALGLVRELLEGLGLRHTLAVFLPEANLLKPSQQQQQQQAEQPEGDQSKEARRAELRAALGMAPSDLEKAPLLVELIHAARGARSGGKTTGTAAAATADDEAAMYKTAFLAQEEDDEAEPEEEEEEEGGDKGDTSDHARALEAAALRAGGQTAAAAEEDDDALSATAGEPSGSEAEQQEAAELERSTEPETGADD